MIETADVIRAPKAGSLPRLSPSGVKTITRWQAVVGYEGLYEVSDTGDVRNTATGRGRVLGRVLRPAPSKKGYLSVSLCREGLPRTHLVHHLVIEAFRGPRPTGWQGQHLNDIKSDNSLDNLVWGPPADNYAAAIKNGRTCRGTRHGMTNITPNVVTVIRFLARHRQNGCCTLSLRAIGQKFDVSMETVRNIRDKKTWGHVPDGDYGWLVTEYAEVLRGK